MADKKDQLTECEAAAIAAAKAAIKALPRGIHFTVDSYGVIEFWKRRSPGVAVLVSSLRCKPAVSL